MTAEPARVLLDCDPGIDDALAIVFGCGHPGLDLVGLTTVSGNVNLDTVTANALSVLELAGRPDVPVVPGSARPLLRPTLDAREVHGEGGLGAARLPAAQSAPASGHAVDYLIDTISAASGRDHPDRHRPADQHRARGPARAAAGRLGPRLRHHGRVGRTG